MNTAETRGPDFSSMTVVERNGRWHALWVEAPAKYWPGEGPTREAAIASVLHSFGRALERRAALEEAGA